MAFFLCDNCKFTMHSLVIVTSLLACAFAAPSTHQRSIGGENAVLGQHPYQASLQFRSGGMVYSHVCGATIISPSWTLTAAQCRDSFDNSRYRVVSGLLTLGQNNEGTQTSSIEEFILHPNYHGGVSTNDIALVLLTIPLKWTDAVQPAKLPIPSNNEPSGEGTLSSWGSGTSLQGVVLPLISQAECASIAGSLGPLDDTQICTGPLDGQKGGCSDDLGSSLVQNGVVLGLLSWTAGNCADAGVPAVYTRTDSHNDFILAYVDDL